MPASVQNQSPLSRSSVRPNATKRHVLAWGAIFLFLMLARVPYLPTHHIQEDAYITFRSAFHLADQGSYSFNLGEHVSGVTSVLYGLSVALLRFVFKGAAIPAIQMFGTAVLVLASMLLAKALFKEFRQQAQFCLICGLVPVGLLISYSGMEIALQALVFCWGLYLCRDGQPGWLILLPAFLLPLVRPDAVALSLLLALLAFTLDRVRGAVTGIASLAGVGGLLLFNRIAEGAFVPNTVRAKEIAYHPSHSAVAIAHRLVNTFITDSFMAPVQTRFFIWAGVLSLPLFCACALVAIRKANGTPKARVMMAMLAAGILIPICFDAGGVLFPWYLWTSAWIMTAFPCYLLLVWIARIDRPRQTTVLAGVAALLIVLMGFQWLVSYNIGKEEFEYRAGIGRDIAAIAHPGDTLLLEPAGYIPFFAGVHTDDDVGLVSDRVTSYRLRDGNGWFMDFIRTERPTFLVERAGIWLHQTSDNAPMTEADWQWFAAHYRLVKSYRYRVSDYVRNPWLLRLMHTAHTADYYLFERVE